jgi:hypothetical protein
MIDITEYKLEQRLDRYNPNSYSISPENFVSDIAEISFPDMQWHSSRDRNFRKINFKFNNPKLANQFLDRFDQKEDLLMKLEGSYFLLYGITEEARYLISDDYLYINESVPKMYNHLLCEITIMYDNILQVDNKVAIRNLKLNSLI